MVDSIDSWIMYCSGSERVHWKERDGAAKLRLRWANPPVFR